MKRVRHENHIRAITDLPLGDTEVTLTITDGSFSPTQIGFVKISVRDTTPPDLEIPPDIIIECDQPIPEPVLLGVSDNCDPDPEVVFEETYRQDPSCPSGYTLKRTWTAVDNFGNTSSLSQLVKMTDSTAPNIYFNALDKITPNVAPISFTATTTDNCDDNPNIIITGYDCYSFTKKGRRIDKTDSCKVAFTGSQIKASQLAWRMTPVILPI